MPSFLLPTFLQRLADPRIKTVMLCGCGGGFDFVHSLILYPELVRLGKSVVIGSYSFGDPRRITGAAEVVFEEGKAIAKRVTAASIPDPYYAPEVHACSYLDLHYPSNAPHFAYAYYARAFSVPMLTRLYTQLIAAHEVDAVALVDGGSDSLMAGDEQGMGDPIEDAVSVATVAGLGGLKARVLISVGLGADRFIDVSDAATLRAVAELTRLGGFLGCVGVEPTSAGYAFYRGCLDHIYERQGFRSVLAGSIASAVEGWFGGEEVAPIVGHRVSPGELFVWPLMAVLWGFDVETVARRSLIAGWIRGCETVAACHDAYFAARVAFGAKLRGIENLPRHEEMSSGSSPYSA